MSNIKKTMKHVSFFVVYLFSMHIALKPRESRQRTRPEVLSPGVPFRSDSPGIKPDVVDSAVTARMRWAGKPHVSRSIARSRTIITKASWYGSQFHGRRMANGQRFNMNDPTTCASVIFPLGARLRVTNTRNNTSIIVRVTDRGPFASGRGLRPHPTRAIDLSRAAFARLASLTSGVIEVKVETILEMEEGFPDFDAIVDESSQPVTYSPPESPGHLDLAPLF